MTRWVLIWTYSAVRRCGKLYAPFGVFAGEVFINEQSARRPPP
jgi:hypothetical protein